VPLGMLGCCSLGLRVLGGLLVLRLGLCVLCATRRAAAMGAPAGLPAGLPAGRPAASLPACWDAKVGLALPSILHTSNAQIPVARRPGCKAALLNHRGEPSDAQSVPSALLNS
jgi:hypothetical protein